MRLTGDFTASLVGAVCGEREKDYRLSDVRVCMVLTHSMATTSNAQGDEPPRSTALERQVQTLMTAVERLTKQNHDLEEQLRQRDAEPNPQERNQEGDSAERRERENPEDSNIPSRQEWQSKSLPSLTDPAPYLSSQRCRR